MIYYRKTLFGCGPKLTAVHSLHLILNINGYVIFLVDDEDREVGRGKCFAVNHPKTQLLKVKAQA